MAITKKPNYVVDSGGKRVGVLLDIGEYERLLDELEELEDVRAYDTAKAANDKPVPFEDAIRRINRRLNSRRKTT